MCHHYACDVARWQPDARGRLGEAAMELYAERGYDQVTVAEIAQRAGLTTRTFFRYFADKREVLFAGSGELLDGPGGAVRAAPPGATPLQAVMAARDIAAEMLGGGHEPSWLSQSVIASH